jgi:hypothetical protein
MLAELVRIFDTETFWSVAVTYMESFTSLWKLVFTGSVVAFLILCYGSLFLLFPDARRLLLKARKRFVILVLLILNFLIGFLIFAQERHDRLRTASELQNTKKELQNTKEELQNTKEVANRLTLDLSNAKDNVRQLQKRFDKLPTGTKKIDDAELKRLDQQVAELRELLNRRQSQCAVPSVDQKLAEAALRGFSGTLPPIRIGIGRNDYRTLECAYVLKVLLQQSSLKVDDIFDPVFVTGRDFIGLRFLVPDPAHLSDKAAKFKAALESLLGPIEPTAYSDVPVPNEFILFVGVTS